MDTCTSIRLRKRRHVEALEDRTMPAALAPLTPGAAWPAQVYAPYTNMGLSPMIQLTAVANASGVRYFSLGFMIADTNNNLAWNGSNSSELNSTFDATLRPKIVGLRAIGGDVVPSFGGAAGNELAIKVSNVQTLVNDYQSVITAYGLTHIDFDIEGSAIDNHAATDRRNQAIAILEANNPSLKVSFTLSVTPQGLFDGGKYLLSSAQKYHVNVNEVNLMTMDYWDAVAPNPSGHMGDYAIQAANSAFVQVKAALGTGKTDAQLWHMIGITPMIGQNDTSDEVFTLAAAAQVEAFAQSKGIGLVSIWAVERDQQSAASTNVNNYGSGVQEASYGFSHIFEAIGSATPVPIPVPVPTPTPTPQPVHHHHWHHH